MMYNNVNTGYKYLKVFFAQALNNLFVKKRRNFEACVE